ncbi:membrane protein [Cohnella xylanilytica]|uniref:Threonine/serine exporter family protein n=1 Tax=Cohnella xylanilytica TaxID=557555 RepID=A0A841TZM2_9BACL|nr:threonine/serine exporter family protein [Cohnella xylanilytica]MBB6693726.1 threonine/serine exporter family protein [Cohnella xylanilytica]GIO16798.1 membrane protein [Cohnella xylanilytica]
MTIEPFVASFVASAGFAVLFNVPWRNVGFCGLVGMVGWMIYETLRGVPVEPILATLTASFAVTVVSQLLAKACRAPIIVFSVSGIVPLVPGGTAYDAMLNVVQNHYDMAVQRAFEAFMLSGAIAFGLVFSEVINHAIRKAKL